MSGSSITLDDYEGLKRFFEEFARRYFPENQLPPEHQPIALLEVLEKRGHKTALKGLQQMITDCIEMSLGLPAEEVGRFDSEMSRIGVIGLSEVRRRCSDRYNKVIKSGKIRTEKDYRIVRVIADNLSIVIPQEERALIGSLLFEYEERAGSRGSQGGKSVK